MHWRLHHREMYFNHIGKYSNFVLSRTEVSSLIMIQRQQASSYLLNAWKWRRGWIQRYRFKTLQHYVGWILNCLWETLTKKDAVFMQFQIIYEARMLFSMRFWVIKSLREVTSILSCSFLARRRQPYAWWTEKLFL